MRFLRMSICVEVNALNSAVSGQGTGSVAPGHRPGCQLFVIKVRAKVTGLLGCVEPPQSQRAGAHDGALKRPP